MGESLRLSIHFSVTVPTHNPLIVIVLNVGIVLHERAFHRRLHYSVCKHSLKTGLTCILVYSVLIKSNKFLLLLNKVIDDSL